MKVLGISFGRRNERCDIMVKEALFAAKKAGAQVEFVNTVNMNIGHCKGCGACSTLRDRGGQIRCVLKDDYLKLEEKVLDADGIIIAAPVYVVGINGQLKNFVDRFGPAHDYASMLEENKRRKEAGKSGEELLDPRYFKNRYCGYISVGGAYTHHWVSLGLPMMHLFGMSNHMLAVGQIDAYDQGRTATPVLDEELMKRCSELGTHVAQSIGKPYGSVDWYGEQRVCPVCHNDLISIGPDMGTTVECPICGIKGELSIQDGKIKVEFSEQEKNRARGTLNGVYEHYYEIEEMKRVAIPKIMKNKEKIEELTEKYKHFEERIENM